MCEIRAKRARSAGAGAAAMLALAVAGCGGGGEETLPSGSTLYTVQGCDVCHGADRRGTDDAPALSGLRANWDEERLVRYLADPGAVIAGDPRLSANAERYPAEMPAFGDVPELERRAIARWLLAD